MVGDSRTARAMICGRTGAGVCAAALVVLASADARAQSAPLPLDRLLSAPFPSALTAAPAGGLVAWVQNLAGARNLWVATPPDYRARQITRYAKDDGQEIGGITWTPDGGTIVYVRGGGANRAGEVPNPTSDPAGVEEAIWQVAVAGGTPRRIGVGSNPEVSPRGDRVVFTRRGQIFSAPLAGAGDPVQLVSARGGAGSLRWSPDGSKLAFSSGRGDHAFIGVYDFAGKSLRYMSPSVDGDGSPVWSRDGARLAFIREPASSRLTLFAPVRSAQPWSIMVADVATGEARTVWRAESGVGSAFQGVVAEDQLFWGAGDRLVFPWERDGWQHLYAVPAGGGQATLLTPGEFEVDGVTMTPDGTRMIYNSNQGDIDRRDIWEVVVAGGAPTAITRGNDIEWSPVVTSDGKAIAFLRSGARRPAHAAIRVGTREVTELAPQSVPSTFPEQQLVEPEPVVFTAADGMRIHGQLFRPPAARAGERHAALLFLHGGSRRQMLLGWHYIDYYNKAYAMNQRLASLGYVVLAVNYRSGTGYGMEFREALNYGATGASEFQDVLGAGLYLRSRPDVDSTRIGLWGGSYGGYLTAMGLARASSLFAAGVDFHGVHDWNVGIRTFVPSYNRLERPEESRLAFQSSPMAYIDGWRSPVLVIHGDDDRNVSFAETVTLVEALRERGVEVEQLVFPDEVHGFLTHASWMAAYGATERFFERKLKN